MIVYFANCIRQPERKLPRPSTTWSCRYSNHWSCNIERGHTCMYIKEHADIVNSGEKFHFCSDSLSVVLRVVSCKVWFGLRLLMQLTSNTKINFSLPLSLATRVTTQRLKQPIFFCNVVPGQLTACICESHVPFGNRKCYHQNGNNFSSRSYVNSTNLLRPPLVSMERAPITPKSAPMHTIQHSQL